MRWPSMLKQCPFHIGDLGLGPRFRVQTLRFGYSRVINGYNLYIYIYMQTDREREREVAP